MSGKKTVKSKKVERRKKTTVAPKNIFEELGLDQSEELLVRSQLLDKVTALIHNSGLSQKDVGKKLGIAQSKVSKLVTGRLSEFSTDTLLRYLSILGCNVQIKVSNPPSKSDIFGKKGNIEVRQLPSKRRRVAGGVKEAPLNG